MYCKKITGYFFLCYKNNYMIIFRFINRFLDKEIPFFEDLKIQLKMSIGLYN